MKSKVINKFIMMLLIILMTITIYTVDKYIKIREQRKIIPIQTTKDNTSLISEYMLITKLNKENKMLVLSGEATMEVLYSNKDISDDDINFKWVKDWLSEMNSKDLNVRAVYTYQFHYDLEDLNIDIVDNIPNIYLSRNRLRCQVELLENKSVYTDRVGLLESQFTPQEVNSLNGRTKDLVYNKLQADKELRDKAMNNVKDNIQELLGVKCNFSISTGDVVEYYDENVIKIN